jgi:hypothetical protein
MDIVKNVFSTGRNVKIRNFVILNFLEHGAGGKNDVLIERMSRPEDFGRFEIVTTRDSDFRLETDSEKFLKGITKKSSIMLGPSL